MRIKLESRKKIQERHQKYYHLWFAWYPVRINDEELIWLDFIWRILIDPHDDGYYKWRYKEVSVENTNSL